MGFRDLGIVVAGGMAGLRYMPEIMNKKIFAHLERAGILYEQNGVLDEGTIQQLGQPYRYSDKQLKRLCFQKNLD